MSDYEVSSFPKPFMEKEYGGFIIPSAIIIRKETDDVHRNSIPNAIFLLIAAKNHKSGECYLIFTSAFSFLFYSTDFRFVPYVPYLIDFQEPVADIPVIKRCPIGLRENFGWRLENGRNSKNDQR